jgi:hypothetical protein
MREKRNMKRTLLYALLLVALFAIPLAPTSAADDRENASPIIPQLTPAPTFSDTTVPLNGDVNPYGVAFVPDGFAAGGPLHAGDVIVSNFNNSLNLQGTGTTIVKVNNGNLPTVFFQGPQGLGLTTALGVLRRGYVLVGNLPSLDGSGQCLAESGPAQNVGQGGVLVIDKHGHLVKTLADASLLNGPWDLTVKDEGDHALVFVANALSGAVTRLDLRITGDGDGDRDDRVIVERATQIASGYVKRCDPAAFVIGPTGVALDEERDILYVSSTGDNAIYAIRDASDRTSDAGKGDLVVSDAVHLHGPLGLAIAPNGDLLSTQGDAINFDPTQVSELVEFTPKGKFVAEVPVDPSPGGAFGLAIRPFSDGFIFATVDDNTVVLDIWVVR